MKKFDMVVEAVRYKNGKIDVVRGYERRGAAFTDWIILDRKTLLERLKAGKVLVTGQRKQLLAGTFDVGKPIKMVGNDGKQVVSTRTDADHDELEGVPSF